MCLLNQAAMCLKWFDDVQVDIVSRHPITAINLASSISLAWETANADEYLG